MKHMMMDCYGAVNFTLDDMTRIYDLLNGLAAEAKLDVEALIEEAIANTEKITVKYYED